jgi:hypothetical protein
MFEGDGNPVELDQEDKLIELGMPKWSTVVYAARPPVSPRLRLKMEMNGAQREIEVPAITTLKDMCDIAWGRKSERYTIWRDLGDGPEILPQEWSAFDLEVESGTVVHFAPAAAGGWSDSSDSEESDEAQWTKARGRGRGRGGRGERGRPRARGRPRRGYR